MSAAKTDNAKENKSPVTYLKDYQAPDFYIRHVDLTVDIHDGETFVTARSQVERNGTHNRSLVLDGEEMDLLEISIDGQALSQEAYSTDEESLNVQTADDKFTLETKVRIVPEKNVAFEGLYKSGANYYTQCEAQGFRRITYFVDRPDNMATFTTKIIGDEKTAPVMLSNGNPVDSGKMEDGRHYTVWDDPGPKPCYLFALVGGDLDFIEDHFITMSGRKVALKIYALEKDQDKLPFAMESLKRAMKWDEDTYGREYHLDLFNIVAVDDFNMGAMENTSLNIFNTSCVLAHPDVSTDAQYQRVDAVIAHEYFHNWTGNLVTCRDWFQLCLKEGLTVFRDQSYQGTFYGSGVQRIDDVKMLRSRQFREDAGPMAHPPRPDHFETINNFYTVTVYEKGAELNRMIRRLVGGAENFRKGSDLYFKRFEGQAITVEDWVKCHEDATGRDLGQFMRWYTQAGTPTVKASWDYDDDAKTFTMTLEQDVPVIDGVSDGKPRHIPVQFGLVGPNGDDVVDELLELTESKQSFTFENVPPGCVPSIMRDFSAPVYLDAPYTDADLLHLMVHDNDGFNQWEAGNRFFTGKMQAQISRAEKGEAVEVPSEVVDVARRLLERTDMAPDLKALALTLPDYSTLALARKEIDPQAILAVRDAFTKAIAKELRQEWQSLYDELHDPQKGYDRADAPERALKNKALAYLGASGDGEAAQMVVDQYYEADNITDRIMAFAALLDAEHPDAAPHKDAVIADFYDRAKKAHELVVDKWVMAQAQARGGDIMGRLHKLQQHESVAGTNNPNRIRALYGAFSGGNPDGFHAEDGSGYKFLADFIMQLDGKNPQVASRLVDALGDYKRYKPALSEKMYGELCRMAQMPKISIDLAEKVRKFVGKSAYDNLRNSGAQADLDNPAP